MTDSPTPEVAAYWESRHSNENAVHTLVRNLTLIATAAAVAITAMASVLFIKLDEKESAVQRTQSCQTTSFNKILKDVRLAFGGDHKAADYAKAPKKC